MISFIKNETAKHHRVVLVHQPDCGTEGHRDERDIVPHLASCEVQTAKVVESCREHED